jgi:phage shock protein C
MEQAVRHLVRSRKERVFAGVCGGLAAYLGLDPVLVRVLYVALTLLSWGMGILLYLIAWIIMPLEEESAVESVDRRAAGQRQELRKIAGIFLVIVGILALFSLTFGWLHLFSNLRLAGPILLMLIGLALLLWRRETAGPSATSHAAAEEAPESGTDQTAAGNDYSIPKRLMRSEKGRRIAGVCAGLGHYFGVDPTILRLIFIALVFAGGSGLILYVIMWIVVPLEADLSSPQLGT